MSTPVYTVENPNTHWTQFCKPPPELSVSDTLAIIVLGSEPNTIAYTVHRDLICHYSPYFSRLFLGPFRERDTLVTRLDVTEVDFVRFMDWLYDARKSELIIAAPLAIKIGMKGFENGSSECSTETRTVSSSSDDVASTPRPTTTGRRRPYDSMRYWTQKYRCKTLLNLYILADKYDIPLMRDDIMKDFFYVMAVQIRLPSFGFINTAFEQLPANSGLCRLLVDVTARYWDEDREGKKKRFRLDYLDYDFLIRLVRRFAERGNSARSQTVSPNYQLHITSYLCVPFTEVCNAQQPHGYSALEQRAIMLGCQDPETDRSELSSVGDVYSDCDSSSDDMPLVLRHEGRAFGAQQGRWLGFGRIKRAVQVLGR